MILPPRLFRSFVFLGFALLAGCAEGGTRRISQFIPPGTPGGRQCVIDCGKAKEHAQTRCAYLKRDCWNQMQIQAIRDYEVYAREQMKARESLELLPRDFERPAKCAPVDCDDDAERAYRVCFQECGGKIEEISR